MEKEKREQADRIIKNFLKDNYIKETTLPVDIFEMATNLGFDVRGAFFEDNIDGIMIADETVSVIEGFESNKIIVYNNLRTLEEIRFIVAHELSHYIKKYSEEKESGSHRIFMAAARDHSDRGYSDNSDEQFIDYMAAVLLVPTNSLKEKYASYVKTKTNREFSKLAFSVSEEYQVEIKLARRRLEEVFC